MKRGSITIFLALIMSVVLSLTTVCIESTRMAAARVQILSGVDVGLFSLFGHYDRTLLQDFDLFSINAGGKGGDLNLAGAYDIFENYMKPVLKQNSQKLSYQNGGITGYLLLTDHDGEVFYRQVVEYMKDTLGGQGISLLLNKIQDRVMKTQDAEANGEMSESQNHLESYEEEMESAAQKSLELEERLAEEKDEYESYEYEDGDYVDDAYAQGNDVQENTGDGNPVVKNPIPFIKRLREMSILNLVIPSSSEISQKELESTTLLSRRHLKQGFQMEMQGGYDHSQTSEFLYQQYILNRLGDFIQPSNAALSYEMEYVLFGKTTDMENLSKMAGRLLLVREGINMAHIMGNSAKKAEVQALSMGIASAFLVPPAASIIQAALYLCWSFAESVLDVRKLFEGKKIPMIKTASNWQISLDHLSELFEELETEHGSDESGISYEDYLQIFLWVENRSDKLRRSMDMIESKIRKKTNRATFGLDSCICGMSVSVNVRANSRKSFHIEKEYRYE